MIILIQCKDQVGLVAGITHILANEQLNIISLREYVDKAESLFFMRLETDEAADAALLEIKIKNILPPNALVRVNPLPVKKIVVMVTKEYHCLADILTRNFFNTLNANVQCVVGNYAALQNICERFSIPFYFISHEQKDKQEFEQAMMQVIQQYTPDYIVLAKFMRVLSPQFVARFPMRIINIHHSFLPAFVGANPYRQAFERGVKLIGATAHYVSNELDEGPIITQQINPVNHSFSVTDMVKAGKEIETAVLAKALKMVFEDRVFIYNNKTVLFE